MWSFSIQIGNIWNTVWGTHDTSIFQKFVCEMGSEPPLLPSKHNSKSIRKKMTEMDLLSQVSCISVVIHQKYSWDGHKFLFQTENFMKYLDSSILIVGQGKSVNWSSLMILISRLNWGWVTRQKNQPEITKLVIVLTCLTINITCLMAIFPPESSFISCFFLLWYKRNAYMR